MAFNKLNPTDTEFIANGPGVIRENFNSIVATEAGYQTPIVNAKYLNSLTQGNASGNIPVSNGTVCTNLNADKLDGNDASYFATSGHVHNIATSSSNGFLSNTDKAKLDTVASGAEVNQNAFSNIIVGATTIQAESKTDSLELVAGSNISLTADVNNDKVTITNTYTYTHPTGDGNFHVPATGTTNNGKVLTAGSTAGSLSWTFYADTTKAPIDHSSTATTYGVSSATEYGHAMASSTTPLVAGTAAVGTDNGKYARADHVHPAQTSITGNAGTATSASKLTTARTINGVSFDGTANITLPYASSTVYGTAKIYLSGSDLYIVTT